MDWFEIESPLLRARITARGAGLVGLWRKGWETSLVLGTEEPADLLAAHPFAGTVVGPVANRIGGARMSIAGRTHDLPANVAPNTLHSGPDGLHARDWEAAARGTDHVTLNHTLPDGACGLPGTRQVSAAYRVIGDRLTVTLSANSDADTAMNLALHPYWTMTGAPGLQGHRLWLAAERYLTMTDALLPTGQSAPLKALGLTPHRPCPIGDVPLDHNICLAPAPRPAPMFAARLDAGRAGPRLHVYTTAPGLQVYDGRDLPDVAHIGPYAGLALEPQMWPDAMRHAGFPDITLKAGQHWQQTTTYRVELR
ncbi:MAG: aldose epimerase family protein [Pseudomonadota bacterium]